MGLEPTVNSIRASFFAGQKTFFVFLENAIAHLCPRTERGVCRIVDNIGEVLGPVGIIQVIHYGWTVGVKEALYWLGLISLNLGVLNLLPLPVLDGGHICFSLYEIFTKKRVNHKIVERIIIPFFILIVVFFIYMMYSDLSKLFTYLSK